LRLDDASDVQQFPLLAPSALLEDLGHPDSSPTEVKDTSNPVAHSDVQKDRIPGSPKTPDISETIESHVELPKEELIRLACFQLKLIRTDGKLKIDHEITQ